MNPTLENTQFFDILETLIESGPAEFREVLRLIFNTAMKIERNQFLQADPYERNESRRGYANGYKPKTLNTRLGPMTVEIPQVRGLKFYPKSLEKGSRSEKALKLAVADLPAGRQGCMLPVYPPGESPRSQRCYVVWRSALLRFQG